MIVFEFYSHNLENDLSGRQQSCNLEDFHQHQFRLIAMSKTKRLKHLSATTAVCLGILGEYPDGMTLDEAVDGYEEVGLEVGRRAICTYLNRVKHLGFIRTKKTGNRTIYQITKDGRKELEWWRAFFA
jgi:Cdc6-like AAA superfamily ATPase